MKASIKFREDEKPLFRAKVPISIFGLPFLSGVAAGDSADLRFDLSTAFDSGPSVRISYRPNDSFNPFSLSVKTGIGALGSPAGASLAMTAEFGLLGSHASARPMFCILFKPRSGDFSVKKSIRSPASDSSSINGVSNQSTNTNGVENGERVHVRAAASNGGGIAGLLAGVEVTAKSVLPVLDRAAVRFRWGLRVPPELQRPSEAGVSLTKIMMPLLIMSKVSIEHVARKPKSPPLNGETPAEPEAAVASFPVRCQIEELQKETRVLKVAVEEIRTEIAGGRVRTAGREKVSGGDDVSKEVHVAGSGERDLKQSDASVALGELDQELRKALEKKLK